MVIAIQGKNSFIIGMVSYLTRIGKSDSKNTDLVRR